MKAHFYILIKMLDANSILYLSGDSVSEALSFEYLTDEHY